MQGWKQEAIKDEYRPADDQELSVLVQAINQLLSKNRLRVLRGHDAKDLVYQEVTVDEAAKCAAVGHGLPTFCAVIHEAWAAERASVAFLWQ